MQIDDAGDDMLTADVKHLAGLRRIQPRCNLGDFAVLDGDVHDRFLVACIVDHRSVLQ